jgi:hypothetical protein
MTTGEKGGNKVVLNFGNGNDSWSWGIVGNGRRKNDENREPGEGLTSIAKKTDTVDWATSESPTS